MTLHCDPQLDYLQNPVVQSLLGLFEQLSDVLFWIKDDALRLRAINPAFAAHVKRPPSAVLGRTDADFYAPEIARAFMNDDRHVLRSGQPLLRKFELLTGPMGTIEWRSTTKLPLRDARGHAIGTTGISRPVAIPSEHLPAPYATFAGIIDFARTHLASGVDVPAIAAFANMSVPSLNRRFRQYLNIAPGAFLNHLRFSQACELLQSTPLNIGEIAQRCGYENPSAFSRAFRQQLHCAPSVYRKRGAVSFEAD